MANRAYLYATDLHPDDASMDAQGPDDHGVIGLSEAPYAAPLSYRILLSGEPTVCRSLIWDGDRIGVAGDFESGLLRLGRFLDRLAQAAPELREACADTRAFLSAPSNRKRWAVLEAGELFDMADEAHAQQAAALLREIQAVDAEAERFLQAVAGRGLYKRQSVDVQTDLGIRRALATAGIGFWTNVLHFDLKADGEREAVSRAPSAVNAFARLPALPEASPPRPSIPFWGPVLSTAVIVNGVTLSGYAPTGLGPWEMAVGFFSTYAAMTALWTLAVWGVWWARRARPGGDA